MLDSLAAVICANSAMVSYVLLAEQQYEILQDLNNEYTCYINICEKALLLVEATLPPQLWLWG